MKSIQGKLEKDAGTFLKMLSITDDIARGVIKGVIGKGDEGIKSLLEVFVCAKEEDLHVFEIFMEVAQAESGVLSCKIAELVLNSPLMEKNAKIGAHCFELLAKNIPTDSMNEFIKLVFNSPLGHNTEIGGACLKVLADLSLTEQQTDWVNTGIASIAVDTLKQVIQDFNDLDM